MFLATALTKLAVLNVLCVLNANWETVTEKLEKPDTLVLKTQFL
jgi:hypothetical protein